MENVECAGIHGHLVITKAQFFEDGPPAFAGSLFREEPLTKGTSEKGTVAWRNCRMQVDDTP
jgi:hypothetical protein